LSFLSSNSSIENLDLSCFDSNENVHQCAIAMKSGACRAIHQLTGGKKTTHAYENKLLASPQYANIYHSSNFVIADS